MYSIITDKEENCCENI